MALSELLRGFELFPQILINVPVAGKRNFRDIPEIRKVIDETEKRIQQRGRVLVRASGTEPKIRVMVECDSHDLAQSAAQDIADEIGRRLGAQE